MEAGYGNVVVTVRLMSSTWASTHCETLENSYIDVDVSQQHPRERPSRCHVQNYSAGQSPFLHPRCPHHPNPTTNLKILTGTAKGHITNSTSPTAATETFHTTASAIHTASACPSNDTNALNAASFSFAGASCGTTKQRLNISRTTSIHSGSRA